MSATLCLIDHEGIKAGNLSVTMSALLLARAVPKGFGLSFRDQLYAEPYATCSFVIGSAVARVVTLGQTHNNEVHWYYEVSIESLNAEDHYAAWCEVQERLGMPVENLTPWYWGPQDFLCGFLDKGIKALDGFIRSLTKPRVDEAKKEQSKKG